MKPGLLKRFVLSAFYDLNVDSCTLLCQFVKSCTKNECFERVVKLKKIIFQLISSKNLKFSIS